CRCSTRPGWRRCCAARRPPRGTTRRPTARTGRRRRSLRPTLVPLHAMPPSPATAPARRRAPAPPAATWRVALALALPFLVMVAALQGLTATLPTFHGSDEA